MGLQMYVGSLGHYYAGDWRGDDGAEVSEWVLAGRAIRDGAGVALTDAAAISGAVESWRRALNQKLLGHLKQVLAWDETEGAQYFPEPLGQERYAALLLLAAYDERSDDPRPTEVPAQWSADPVWQECSANDFADTYYPQILAAQFWLPNRFDFIIPHTLPAGQGAWIGSSSALIPELRRLTGSAFGHAANSGTPTDADTPFDRAAKHAIASYLKQAELSVRHRLPMLLDW